MNIGWHFLYWLGRCGIGVVEYWELVSCQYKHAKPIPQDLYTESSLRVLYSQKRPNFLCSWRDVVGGNLQEDPFPRSQEQADLLFQASHFKAAKALKGIFVLEMLRRKVCPQSLPVPGSFYSCFPPSSSPHFFNFCFPSSAVIPFPLKLCSSCLLPSVVSSCPYKAPSDFLCGFTSFCSPSSQGSSFAQATSSSHYHVPFYSSGFITFLSALDAESEELNLKTWPEEAGANS